MLDWVPEPVCHTTSGNWSSRRPSSTSSQAAAIASRCSAVMAPSSALACAAAFLRTANARTMPRGMVSVPIGKFSWLRWVCAPQRASTGTRISPIESCSTRHSPSAEKDALVAGVFPSAMMGFPFG